MRIIYLISIFSFITIQSIHAQSDCTACKDYPLLPRMPNFYIQNYQEYEFGSEDFYFDKARHTIEGKRYRIDYRHNNYKDKDFAFPSRLQILRNYFNAIKDAGGRVLFERANSSNGYYNFVTASGKEIWVKITPAYYGKSYKIFIIEREKMRQDLSITADLIKNKIDIYGKVTLQGIYFDVAKSTIRKESETALIEISKFLNENPSIKCWVVGHTDSDGSFELNSKLSLERAKAIKTALETNYKVVDNRLFAEGVGPLAPIANNKTEEGKQQNRRVELVLK